MNDTNVHKLRIITRRRDFILTMFHPREHLKREMGDPRSVVRRVISDPV